VSIINTSRKVGAMISRAAAPLVVMDAEDEGPQLPGKKVLLVDDNQVNLKLASELIRLWGHEVCEAEHGKQAFELYRRESFDLVILDIQMPDIDGVSLMQMMRELDPEDNTPMVALTANVLNHEADRLLDLGFDYFLGKPIDEAAFRALLDGQPQRRPLDDEDEIGPLKPDCSLDYTRSLALSAGNESLLTQILEILKRDIPEQRQQLKTVFAEQDLDRLGALAHKLQGVTCYASLPRLRRIVVALQQQLGDGSPASLEPLMRQLDKELLVVAEEVEHYLRQLEDRVTADQDSSTAIATT